MFVSECLNINEKGNLTIGGCDTIKLAKEYGTPLYVMDEALIRKNCGIYVNALKEFYGQNALALYASKAFCTVAMCKIVNQEGMGIDVVSGGELYTALKANFPTGKIYFHGNNKTYDELSFAVKNNVGRIVVDNYEELKMLNEIASNENKKVKISFRIKPGIDAHTHDFVKTGQIDSKFGVALENGEAFEIIKKTLDFKNVEFIGIHCHIGSQIFDIAPFELAATVMLTFAKKLKDELNIEVKELNLGGGYGIKYTENDDPVAYDSNIKIVSKVIKEFCKNNGILVPFIVMEPGRSIVASAGITLYTIGSIKEIKGYRTYVSIDGGMPDNPRYALYKSKYSMVIANKANQEQTENFTIAGKCCESGDLIGENMPLQKAGKGDILAVLATGAYNYSMSSNYNRIPKPPVIFVNNGVSKVVLKRETYEDIVRNDI